MLCNNTYNFKKILKSARKSIENGQKWLIVGKKYVIL